MPQGCERGPCIILIVIRDMNDSTDDKPDKYLSWEGCIGGLLQQRESFIRQLGLELVVHRPLLRERLDFIPASQTLDAS